MRASRRETGRYSPIQEVDTDSQARIRFAYFLDEAAAKMGVSPHTVHVYVKTLYRRYNVSSRGELLSKWVAKAT